MTDTSEEDRLLAGEYALGLLAAEEARAFEARLQAEPALRALHESWAEDMAGLLANVPDVPPPPAVKAALERRLFPEESQSLWRRLGILPALGGALAAALIALAVSLWVTPAPLLVARIAAADDSLIVAAAWQPDSGTLRLDRRAGAALPGRALELWLIAGTAPPVSLGLLQDAALTEIVLPAEAIALLPGATLALSDEPPGGSPTGQPTGAVLALGPLLGT